MTLVRTMVAKVGLGLALVLGGVSVSTSVDAQRIVDTSPRFAANTASALHRPYGSAAVGPVGFVGGFPVGYRVHLAGQNPNFSFSPYGTPRQYGAHDHGFRHVRQPGQAHFNQFGRNHWVARPIWPCYNPCPPVCFQPWPPVCVSPPLINGCHPWYLNTYACSPWGGWNQWVGWSTWGHGGGWGGGVWGGVSVSQRFGFGGGQVRGLGGGAWFGGEGMFANQGAGTGVPFGPAGSQLAVSGGGDPWQTANFSDAWINGQAAVVMAQHAAIAQAEAQAAADRRQDVMGKTAQDPLGNPRPSPASTPAQDPGLAAKDVQADRSSDRANQVTTQIKQESAAKRSAIAAREKRLAAQAEAERQRLLDTLRQ